jgi:hypothetical protein
MTNAPERIWIEDEFGDGDDDQWTYGTWDVRNYRDYVVEYVRADIVQALTAERDRLRGGIEYVLDGYGLNGPDYRFQDGEDGDWISDRLVAALKGETP